MATSKNDLSEKPVAPSQPGTWLGVHVLTEFIYCPRAGIIAFEQHSEDTGEELDRAPRLDYLPDFSVPMIEAALEQVWNRIWRTLAWASPVLLLTGVTSYFVDWRLMFLLVPFGIAATGWLVRELRDIATLSDRLKASWDTPPQELDSDSLEQQPVNWWALLKAGFSPVEYEDAHIDPHRALAGKPWRVLHKGALRIPVFRKRHGSDYLHHQHYVRIAAYCHLLEEAEGGQSPYGVVLFGAGYDGITIPMLAESRSQFEAALSKARVDIDAAQAGRSPDPAASNVCRECPIGRPRVHTPGVTDVGLDAQKDPYLTRGVDRRLYHSECGDRFRWVPPHKRAKEKQLR